ncbi:MAG: trigger factor [Candidatus Moranbacteria bacterium]|jgi:trigger factor|nr:trigger factor [Candidatus Moranbacteria bacterium]MBP9801421.1 trigger factor [Candidatus Moranbacteria bacterium]
MDIIVKKLPASQVEMRVTLAWDEWSKECDHAAEQVAKEVKVSGFRPGKVPRALIEKRYGKEVVLHEAAEHAVSHAYSRALTQEHIHAIGKPDVKLENAKEDEELVFTVTTAVLPEVKIADTWRKSAKVAITEHKKKEDVLVVEAKEVEEELQRLALMRAKFITVNRPAALEDSVEIDFEVRRDGVIIEGGKSEKHALVLGKGVFIPGFEEMIVGMQTDEEKTFTLSFPEDYHAKHLAGNPAEFHVKLRLVQERQVPVLDDTFAQGLGDFESLSALQKKISEGMLEEKKHHFKEEGRTVLLDALVAESSIDFPEILIEEEQNRMASEFQLQVENMGMPFEQYLERVGKSLDTLKQDWVEQAKKRLSAGLILEKLAEDDQVEIDSKDIEQEMNTVLQQYKRVQDAEKNIDLERLYAATRGRLRNEKVFEMLERL